MQFVRAKNTLSIGLRHYVERQHHGMKQCVDEMCARSDQQ